MSCLVRFAFGTTLRITPPVVTISRPLATLPTGTYAVHPDARVPRLSLENSPVVVGHFDDAAGSAPLTQRSTIGVKIRAAPNDIPGRPWIWTVGWNSHSSLR